IFVDSYEPFIDDLWKQVKINKMNFQGVMLCPNCKVSTNNQDDATQGGSIPFSPNAPVELNVFGHDGDTLGMNCTQSANVENINELEYQSSLDLFRSDETCRLE
nr:mitochondrial amidoxime reducing component 2-like [Tanacetum cinerariifolium]